MLIIMIHNDKHDGLKFQGLGLAHHVAYKWLKTYTPEDLLLKILELIDRCWWIKATFYREKCSTGE